MQKYWNESRMQRAYDGLKFAPPIIALVVVVLTGTQHATIIVAMLLASIVLAAMVRARLRRRRS
jgi:hypothetical protein